MIENKFVVEVNGPSHFIYEASTWEKKLNLKSKFKERVLPKLGYYLINIDVQDFSEGSF